MKVLALFFLTFVLLATGGCSNGEDQSKDQALLDMKWGYDEQGIQLNLIANKELNQYQGQSHTLMLLLVQFDKLKDFTAYVQDDNHLSQLLMLKEAPKGVISLNRFFIKPGEQRKITIPRLEGTQRIALVAGYAHLDPARSVRLYQIGVDLSSEGFFSKSWQALPEPLVIDLILGGDGVLLGQQQALKRAWPRKPVAMELPLPDVDSDEEF
ncbi:TPA: type VI secretion lipoprotein TssJ [Citrobacter freundii]|nr:type VI secretion lipoprotein TssJ [Citrobacter freundii]